VVQIDSTQVTLSSITFTNLIPSPDGSIQTFTTLPRNVVYADGYLDEYGVKYQGAIVVVPKMLANVGFEYNTQSGVFIKLRGYLLIFQSFPTQEWIAETPGQIACPCSIRQSIYGVPLGSVASINIDRSPN
jgi:hypothetical protein